MNLINNRSLKSDYCIVKLGMWFSYHIMNPVVSAIFGLKDVVSSPECESSDSALISYIPETSFFCILKYMLKGKCKFISILESNRVSHRFGQDNHLKHKQEGNAQMSHKKQ